MTKTALIFEIHGDAYHHMIEWRNDVDLQLIQTAINRSGRARIIWLDRQPRMDQVTELPAPGTARPHSGSFGGGYEYCFFHTPAGWMLRVTNRVQNTFFFPVQTPIPSLVINETDAISMTIQEVDDKAWLGPRGLMDDSSSDRTPTDRAGFPIEGEMYERLIAEGWDSLFLKEYEYCFFPLSVGCEIVVKHPGSGSNIHVTKDVGW